MNFHWELRKGSIRWKLRTWAGQRVRVVEVQRHELRVERLPERGRCRIRYYPPLAACSSAARRGSISAGRIRWRMHSINCPSLIQAKYCP